MLRIRYFLNLTVCFSIFSLTTVLLSQPESWSPYANPSSGGFMGQATIDGVPADVGDWSAAFDQDGNCAGATVLTINVGLAYINMPIYGNDSTTDEDDGMDAGESFTLKLWDSSTGDILEYPTSFDCWYNNNGAPMSNECGDYTTVYNFSVPSLDPNFSVSLDADGGTGQPYSLSVGFAPNATDGFDEGFDTYAPPAPPPPAFDAALSWNGDRYYTQIVNGSSDDLVEHEFGVALAYGSNNLIELSWDNTGWSDLGTFTLTDAFDGLLGIDIDMTQVTSLTLENPSINALKLKVTPLGVEYFVPVAGFTYSTEFLTATFSDASIAGSSAIVSWSWDFDGDGTEDATGAGPHIYTYSMEGTYSASLAVADENGRTDSYTSDVMVAPAVGPTAGFSYVVNQLAVSFSDGSEAGDGAITGWSWDFGDSTTSIEQNPVHVYSNTGVYSVSLTVTDENGLSSDPYTEDVQAGGLSIGPFSFYPNPSSGVFLGQVTLDGVPATEDDVIAAFDPLGNCAGAGTFTVYEGDAYIYNFSIYGDDLTTNDFDEGMDMGEDFTLKLWVSSSDLTINYSDGFSGWSNQNGAPMPGYDDPYVVYNFSTSALQSPVANFSGDPRSGDAPLTVQFMDESTQGSGAITGWVWNFGSGFSGSNEQDPSFEYQNPGVYTVSLTVTDGANSLESSITQENYILVGTAGVNDAPLATDIYVSLMEDETIDMGLLFTENSFDADGDVLDFILPTPGQPGFPSHGTLPPGNVYAPHANYYGFDSFTYTATDPNGESDEGTVSVIIIPDGTDPPVAVIDVEGDPEGDGFVETTEDVTLNGWGSWDPDDCPDPTAGCPPFQGSFQWSTVNAPEDFNLQIPGLGYASFDAPEVEADQPFVFTLRVTDGQFWSDMETVTITVQDNSAPVLDSIGIQYTNQASLSINLSATDEENDALTFDASSSDPDNVTIEVVSSGDTTADLTLSFADGWTGMAFVTASVCDGYHCDSETFSVWVSEPPLGVDDIVLLPEVFALRQNYPNPFNPVTTIAYDIPEISNVRIDMYNILGQKVRTLVNGTHQPGMYHVRWNGTNDLGNMMASGMYFYRISSEEFISVKKLVLMK